MNQNQNDLKEDFCPSCLVVPLAFAGAGATTVGATGTHKKWKKVVLYSGIGTLILTLGFAIWYFGLRKSGCNTCNKM